MAQNRRRNAQEWSEIFSDWQRSGESQRGYCRSEEISISAFGYWRRKIERNDDKHPFLLDLEYIAGDVLVTFVYQHGFGCRKIVGKLTHHVGESTLFFQRLNFLTREFFAAKH